jgi:hypothetical protein
VSVDGPLAAPEGTIDVDHRGGSIGWRDPPVEITDLRIGAELGGGAFSIRDGTAGINLGQVNFGGGWDPLTGQGVVVELDGVAFFAAGTLTQWSGVIAVEPDPDGMALVTGELVLGGGVWEQRADLAGTVLGGPDLVAAADDPLQGIALDLTVRAQTGVRVNNNLGRFDVRWDRLRVGGTVAAPILQGDIRIDPGGVMNLPGKTVELKRGTIRFTGDPNATRWSSWCRWRTWQCSARRTRAAPLSTCSRSPRRPCTAGWAGRSASRTRPCNRRRSRSRPRLTPRASSCSASG